MTSKETYVLEPCIDVLCKYPNKAIAKVHSCKGCNGCLHAFCGHPSEEEGFGHGNTCYKCCIRTGISLNPEKRKEVLKIMFPVSRNHQAT